MRTREQVIREALDNEYQQALTKLTPTQRELLDKIDKSWHDAPRRMRSDEAQHRNNQYDLVWRTLYKAETPKGENDDA